MNESMRYHMCDKKKRYSAKKHGEEELRRIRKTGKIVPPDAHVYHCPFCEGWHLGHAPNPLTIKELENVRKNNPKNPS